MAAWRRAIELSLGDADAVMLRSMAQSRTEPASRGPTGADIAGLLEGPFVFRGGPSAWGCTTRRCSVASNGRWSKVRWPRWTIALALVGSRRSLSKPRHGWCRRRVGRRRTWAIRTNCGQRGFWPVTLASMDRRKGIPCLAHLAQGTVCKILDEEDVKPHKVRYYLERRDPEFSEKMAEGPCVYRKVGLPRFRGQARSWDQGLEPFGGITSVSRANQAAAFERISRSNLSARAHKRMLAATISRVYRNLTKYVG